MMKKAVVAAVLACSLAACAGRPATAAGCAASGTRRPAAAGRANPGAAAV